CSSRSTSWPDINCQIRADNARMLAPVGSAMGGPCGPARAPEGCQVVVDAGGLLRQGQIVGVVDAVEAGGEVRLERCEQWGEIVGGCTLLDHQLQGLVLRVWRG